MIERFTSVDITVSKLLRMLHRIIAHNFYQFSLSFTTASDLTQRKRASKNNVLSYVHFPFISLFFAGSKPKRFALPIAPITCEP